MTAQADSSSRKIAIVGGGLGGLTAARVLQQHGLSPVVFEREPSQESREQGGVLDLHPGTGKAMADLSHRVHLPRASIT